MYVRECEIDEMLISVGERSGKVAINYVWIFTEFFIDNFTISDSLSSRRDDNLSIHYRLENL